VPCSCSASLQHFVRIGQLRALQQKKADPARENRNRKNGLRGFFAWPEADGQGIVIVIDDSGRHRVPSRGLEVRGRHDHIA
jgi:hypothetical protein